MADISDSRERLFKCRRLLLGTSVALLAHYALGIEIKSDADAMGLRFEFADIKKFWIGLWIVWTWALVTYTQYCHELGFDDVPTDIRDGARDIVLRWLVKRQYFRQARVEGGIQDQKGKPSRITVRNHAPGVGAVRSDPNEFHVQIEYGSHSIGAYEERPPAVGIRGLIVNLWAWFIVMTTTRFGTDYFAPFMVAAAALGFGIRALFR
jgi:hypothetical protein